MEQRFGFTLAEVLITLGIIGVVAAMTIPTLIANTHSQQYSAKFKKNISILSQAARLNDGQYGFDYSGINTTCGNNAQKEHPESIQSICGILNATLSGATYYSKGSDIKLIKAGKEITYTIDSPYINQFSTKDLANTHAYMLADGSIIAFHKSLGQYPCTLPVGEVIDDTYVAGTTDKLSMCYGFIDVNGPQGPNKEVSCSSGTNSFKSNNCTVNNNPKYITDIYPIRFHDGVAEPATAAARYVLKKTK